MPKTSVLLAASACLALEAQGATPGLRRGAHLAPARVPFALAEPLGSHMVFQQGIEARIWGTASSGEVVKVALSGCGGGSCTAKAGADGSWACDLPPRAVCATPSTISVVGSSGGSAALSDVMFGEVWGCHGQSNMQIGVGSDADNITECARADNYPMIRIMSWMMKQPWSVASSETVCTGKIFDPFSSVCWAFGRSVFEMLGGNVPVGLVSSSRTSTAIELWSGPDALKQCDQTGVVGQGEMWEPRIVPLLPMAVAGWIWYQGESNVPCSTRWPHSHGMNCGIGCPPGEDACDADPVACANFYACQFPAMITDYRDKFRGGANKPFLFVELAPYTDGLFENDESLPMIREAQKAALKLPNVAMSSAIDLGDHESWMFNIHPRNKTLVGERLALHAKALAYGGSSVVHDGPVLVKATKAQSQGMFGTRVRLQFDGPVMVTQSPNNGICPAPANQCAWVAIDGVNGTIQADPSANDAVIVEAPVATAQEVRYLFGDWPMPTIYGPTGLPAPAFRAPVL